MSEYHRTPPDLDRQREQHRHSHVQLCVLDHEHAGLRLPVVCAGMYMHLLRIRKACLCEQPVSPSFCRTCVHDAHKPYLRILRICVYKFIHDAGVLQHVARKRREKLASSQGRPRMTRTMMDSHTSTLITISRLVSFWTIPNGNEINVYNKMAKA